MPSNDDDRIDVVERSDLPVSVKGQVIAACVVQEDGERWEVRSPGIVLISEMAEHTVNLRLDRRVSMPIYENVHTVSSTS